MDLRKHLDESIICHWAIIRQQANHDCGIVSPAASQAFWPTSSMQQGRPPEHALVTFSLLKEKKKEKGNKNKAVQNSKTTLNGSKMQALLVEWWVILLIQLIKNLGLTFGNCLGKKKNGCKNTGMAD